MLHGHAAEILLQELDLGSQVRVDVRVARGVEVAGEGVGRLVARLVQQPQVSPRRTAGGISYIVESSLIKVVNGFCYIFKVCFIMINAL